MLQAPCPRCGEPSGDALCARCTAYLLRFEPYLVRPGLPGPSIDREVRRGTAMLTLNPNAPIRYVGPAEARDHDAFALQFLRHVGLPDGGHAVLTRGDRAILHRLFRRWARIAPAEDVREAVRAMYADAASLPDLPPALTTHFRSLAGLPDPVPVVEIPEPPGPEPTPSPEP